MSDAIRGGYYLKARCIEDSAIAHAPPHAREVFDYFLRKAFWKDGDEFKRGQLLTSYKAIRDDLRWYVGNRPMRYKLHQIETAAKLLARTGAITKARTTRGLIVTVCNYDLYQSQESYENHSETELKTTRDLRESHPIDETGETGETGKESLSAREGGSSLSEQYLKFRAVHKECERVSEQLFIALVASCRTTDPGGKVIEPDVAGALVDFQIGCECLSTFRPKSPTEKFRNYLRNASRTEERNRGTNFQKKKRGGVNRFGLSDADLLT